MSDFPATNSMRADLTGYASLLGDAFAHKIDLLTKLIQGAHYPSVGRYKERLLARMISQFIPDGFRVGTGFVLFPVERTAGHDVDPLNMAEHRISRECDIIVYDSRSSPAIFQDDDFVVLRPESVRAVVEVKGSLDSRGLSSVLESFYDFGEKWQTCQQFYRARNQEMVPRPMLACTAWAMVTDSKGRPCLNGTGIRKRIAAFYKRKLMSSSLSGFPVLTSLSVYSDYEVHLSGWGDSADTIRTGWFTGQGRFIRFDENGKPYLDGDRTVASLLAGIQYRLGGNFNRFFSYVDETRRTDVLPHKDQGFEPWLDDMHRIKEANADLPT